MIGNKNMNNYKKVIIVIVLSLLVVGPLLTKPKPVHAFSPGVVAVNGLSGVGKDSKILWGNLGTK